MQLFCRRKARLESQVCSAILTTSSISAWPTGCSSSINWFRKASKFSCFSTSSRTRNLAQRPCLVGFCETLALVSTDFGPVDFCALRRLAAICFGVAIGGSQATYNDRLRHQATGARGRVGHWIYERKKNFESCDTRANRDRASRRRDRCCIANEPVIRLVSRNRVY